jgi:hypothetical protein
MTPASVGEVLNILLILRLVFELRVDWISFRARSVADMHSVGWTNEFVGWVLGWAQAGKREPQQERARVRARAKLTLRAKQCNSDAES